MSGEGGAVDELGRSGDAVAVHEGMPRVLYPWLHEVGPVLGEELAFGVEGTAHQHMMEMFYRTPRVEMHRLPDRSAIRNYFPTSDKWTPLVLIVDDSENVHIAPITGDPALRKRMRTAREVFRIPRVNSFNAPDVMHPLLDQMMVCFDDQGAAIGSLVAIQEEAEQGEMLTLVPHEEALRKIRASVLRRRTNPQLAHLFSLADSVLGPGSEFARETGNAATIERHFVFENPLHAIELIEENRGDTETLRSLYAICSSPATESLLGFCESKDEIKQMASIVTKHPSWLMELCRAYNTLCHDTMTAGDPTKLLYERPLESHVYQLGYDLIKTALFHHDDPGFRDDYLQASSAALHDTLNALHAIDLPAKLPKERDMHVGLSDFAVENANDPIQLALVAPIVEQYFLLKLKRIIPGEFERARKFFYNAIGTALYEHANETTGDDEQQLALLVNAFEELHKNGYWKDGFIVQDAGSGDGTRMLKPFLDSPIMQQVPPGTVYAVDADSFPGDQGWIQVQRNFEDPTYPGIHAEHVGRDGIVPINAIVAMWSPPNDLEAPNQQAMFDNFSRSLRKRDGDTRGGVLVLDLPMGYIEDMIREAERLESREMGRATVQFPMGEGRTLEKPFEMMLKHNVIIRAMRAGFRPLNLPEGKGEIKTPAFYRTHASKDRAILVFERVGDPETTLDLAALTDGQVRVGFGKSDRPM